MDTNRVYPSAPALAPFTIEFPRNDEENAKLGWNRRRRVSVRFDPTSVVLRPDSSSSSHHGYHQDSSRTLMGDGVVVFAVYRELQPLLLSTTTPMPSPALSMSISKLDGGHVDRKFVLNSEVGELFLWFIFSLFFFKSSNESRKVIVLKLLKTSSFCSPLLIKKVFLVFHTNRLFEMNYLQLANYQTHLIVSALLYCIVIVIYQ